MRRYKETAEDIEVKDRLWGAVQREAMRFAVRYAEEHVVGERSSTEQENICDTAKAKGYPKGLIRELGSLVRRNMADGDRAVDVFAAYRGKIGLSV